MGIQAARIRTVLMESDIPAGACITNTGSFAYSSGPLRSERDAMKITRGDYSLSCLTEEQQPERIHAYLTRSYWAAGITLELVKRSIAGSLCFGVFFRGEQVAFARVITDRATFAYLADVYVLEEHRGKKLAAWMMETIIAHPELQGLRRFMLATRDAHPIYAKYGFTHIAKPESLMEILKTGLYPLAPKPN
jgi:GNAT superfamily N-acetyltransferase